MANVKVRKRSKAESAAASPASSRGIASNSAASKSAASKSAASKSTAAKAERLSLLIVSGPNLDRLGGRQPEIYGTTTLAEISQACGERGDALGADVTSVQTNQEGDIVQLIGDAEADGHHAILLNAGGYSHTSVAILDAILGTPLPVIEVHLSNPEAREDFRRTSLLSRGCVGKIAGFGAASYELAVDAAVRLVRHR